MAGSGALVAIEQRPCADGAAVWVIEGGRAVEGREDDRRLRALRRGVVRANARLERADADDETVQRTLHGLHRPDYLAALDAVRSERPVMIPELTAPGHSPDVPVRAGLVRAAREGVRTSISAAQRVAAGARFAYALSRPPGHHAGPAWFGGYCYLNTAAAAAVTLLEHGVERVAILDLDLHYPNGTAAIVAANERISLYSLHSAPADGAPRPVTDRDGAREQTVKFAQPPAPREYLASISALTSTLAQHAGALVLSLGYDTLRNDPHGSWSFSPVMFALVGRLLAGARLPICVVQEGGYSLARLAACSHAFASGLMTAERGLLARSA